MFSQEIADSRDHVTLSVVVAGTKRKILAAMD